MIQKTLTAPRELVESASKDTDSIIVVDKGGGAEHRIELLRLHDLTDDEVMQFRDQIYKTETFIAFERAKSKRGDTHG